MTGEKLKQNRRPLTKGARHLREEVLDRNLCTACGMCLDLCPYLAEMGENVAMISDCRGEQGRCYAVCPRTETDLDELRRAIHPSRGERDSDYVLGPHQKIWMSRARDHDVRGMGQYGGTVTALILSGLKSHDLDAALLTRWPEDQEAPFLPIPVVARTHAQVLAAAGSKYTACPTLGILDQTLREGVERLCVVGRPCQILALRKRTRIEDPGFAADRIALALGLFCMWSFSYRDFRRWLRPALGTRSIRKIDIPKGGFVVETDQGRLELPHGDLLKRIREACRRCYDFTAELADLSVGSTEWKDDWNTLIVRTDAGRAFAERAAAEGWIEIEPFPEERELMLREAALNKKKRVLEILQKEARESGQPPYLRIPEKERAYFLNQAAPDPL